MKIKLTLNLFVLVFNLSLISADDTRNVQIKNSTNTTLVVKQNGKEIAFCRSLTVNLLQIKIGIPIFCLLGSRKHRDTLQVIPITYSTNILEFKRINNNYIYSEIIDSDASSVSLGHESD